MKSGDKLVLLSEIAAEVGAHWAHTPITYTVIPGGLYSWGSTEAHYLITLGCRSSLGCNVPPHLTTPGCDYPQGCNVTDGSIIFEKNTRLAA